MEKIIALTKYAPEEQGGRDEALQLRPCRFRIAVVELSYE